MEFISLVFFLRRWMVWMNVYLNIRKVYLLLTSKILLMSVPVQCRVVWTIFPPYSVSGDESIALNYIQFSHELVRMSSTSFELQQGLINFEE